MELNVDKTYLSNNSCFRGQLFHVVGYERRKRFGKDNVLITYERWAFKPRSGKPYKIETTVDWLFGFKSQMILGEQLPSSLQAEFDQYREAAAFQLRKELVY